MNKTSDLIPTTIQHDNNNISLKFIYTKQSNAKYKYIECRAKKNNKNLALNELIDVSAQNDH